MLTRCVVCKPRRIDLKPNRFKTEPLERVHDSARRLFTTTRNRPSSVRRPSVVRRPLSRRPGQTGTDSETDRETDDGDDGDTTRFFDRDPFLAYSSWFTTRRSVRQSRIDLGSVDRIGSISGRSPPHARRRSSSSARTEDRGLCDDAFQKRRSGGTHIVD